jgi:hypothetical protein
MARALWLEKPAPEWKLRQRCHVTINADLLPPEASPKRRATIKPGSQTEPPAVAI